MNAERFNVGGKCHKTESEEAPTLCEARTLAAAKALGIYDEVKP